LNKILVANLKNRKTNHQVDLIALIEKLLEIGPGGKIFAEESENRREKVTPIQY
jgi:hypothetical protein